jgi:hypothetical protein
MDDPDVDEDWQFVDVAIIRMYSLPDEALLQLSSQTVASCIHPNEVVVVNIKNIVSVVAMIPHRPMLPSGVVEDRFFMLEKPGLEISMLGIPDNGYQDDDDNDAGNADVE